MSAGGFLFVAGDDALLFALIALDARLDKTLENLGDQSALLFHDRRNLPSTIPLTNAYTL